MMALILLFIIVCIDNLFSDASVILIFLNFDQNIEPRFLINLTLVTQRHDDTFFQLQHKFILLRKREYLVVFSTCILLHKPTLLVLAPTDE